jgi:hypothetical protein
VRGDDQARRGAADAEVGADHFEQGHHRRPGHYTERRGHERYGEHRPVPDLASKEEVATAAETELWDAYVDELTCSAADGPLIDLLRSALVAALTRMDSDWERRLVATGD